MCAPGSWRARAGIVRLPLRPKQRHARSAAGCGPSGQWTRAGHTDGVRTLHRMTRWRGKVSGSDLLRERGASGVTKRNSPTSAKPLAKRRRNAVRGPPEPRGGCPAHEILCGNLPPCRPTPALRGNRFIRASPCRVMPGERSSFPHIIKEKTICEVHAETDARRDQASISKRS